MFLNKWQSFLLQRLAINRQSIVPPSILLSCDNTISTTACMNASLYDALGLTPKATQSEVKAAYYKLSMMYHPDKNKGSEIAAQKFRDISSAYEVLGNFRLRRLYDKGIIHTAGSQYAKTQETYEEKFEEDDPQTKFYKAHMQKSKVPHASGRTPIYDFDEWSRNHYGSVLERRQEAINKHRKKTEEHQSNIHGVQKEYILFTMLFVVIVSFVALYQEAKHDEVIEKPKTPKS